jgi:RNA polymerase sigma-70 factor (ECF subfamily)
MPPQDPDIARWFAAEVQPHEPMLRAWLRSQFSSEADVDDVIQEAFARIVRTHGSTPIRSAKAYLFITARNLALMQVRHRGVETAHALVEIDGSGILDDGSDVPHTVARAQELEMLTRAVQSLPTRCRQIITLRKIYGLSIKETAAELGLADHTVVVQTAIGIRKIGAYFAAHGDTEKLA